VLGPVNLQMVRSYPEQGVEAWLYPKQGGGTAGVFFRRGGSGADGSGGDGSGADGSGGDFGPGAGLVVYTTSFDLRPGAADGTEPREADGGLSTAGLSGG
jgi:hypothetical protein